MNNLRITDVRALPGDSAFLIDDGKTAILYDTGFAFTGYKVLERIKTALRDRQLDYIFLTHSHYDHALGSAYIKDYYENAKVVACTYAEKIFKKESAKAVMRDLDRKFALKNGIKEYEDLIDNLDVDIAVNDGDIVNAGSLSFKVIELPGHTRCSIGFYCESEKLLLGSETIGVFNGLDDVVPSFLVGYKMTLSSIEKVNQLEITKILLPHYGIIENEKVEFYLKKAKESAITTANDIASMLKSGKSKDECLDYVKHKFYNGYIKTIYPIDAMELNTSIMIELIEKELCNE
ncbi:MAG: MBL fold metallo-hydrolase [Ruminococcus sp.]|nr:MBL fold metallo-hydrolase [Ruminococcus sp.]